MRILPLFVFLFGVTLVMSAQDPVKVDPAHYRVLFENAHMRVLEYRDKPGDKAPMHAHPAYLTYTTASGKTKVILPNGETKVNESAGSEFACHPPAQHATENIGSTDTQEVVVEFKDATNPCASMQTSSVSKLGNSSGTFSPLAYTSATQVMKALQGIGAGDGDRIIFQFDPYTLRAEHRLVTKNPKSSASIHKDEAEFYYVIQGSATLITGRLPSEPSGGATQQIQAGDVLIIPENTPHWFGAVYQPLSYISMHMPPSHSSGMSSSEDVLILKELEQDWLDAYREGDAEKMSKILADDFVGRWGDGSTQTKEEQLKVIRTGEEKHSSNHLDECNVRIYGDTAVVTGLQSEQSMLEGRNGSGTYSYTDVFVKRRGDWQVVASETKRVAGRSARERLIGSWKQVSSEETLPDGSVVHLDEVGLVTYDRSGHMSGQSMRRSEPKQHVPSDSIYQSSGYDAYFGTFTVDEVKHTVTHHVEGGVARQLVGKDLVRAYSFDGDRLILKPTNTDENWSVVFEKNRTY